MVLIDCWGLGLPQAWRQRLPAASTSRVLSPVTSTHRRNWASVVFITDMAL